MSLSAVARAVLDELFRVGEGTRPGLSEAVGNSRPAVATALEELEAQGLVEVVGRTTGHVGRAANRYRVAADAGWVAGIDAGAAHVELVARDLAGTEIALRREQYPPQRRDSPLVPRMAARLLAAARMELGAHGPLRAVTASVPSYSAPMTPPAPEPVAFDVEGFRAALNLDASTRWEAENNVNCAAVAELEKREESEHTFAYLQLGRNIGAAIVLQGRLVRGVHGAAGELYLAPFPWSPTQSPQPASLEAAVGESAFLARVRGASSVDDVVARASSGDPEAGEALDGLGVAAGSLIAMITAVVDPGVVVLTGSLGRHPAVLERARAHAARLTGLTAVESSRLGREASAAGASWLALRKTREEMLNA